MTYVCCGPEATLAVSRNFCPTGLEIEIFSGKDRLRAPRIQFPAPTLDSVQPHETPVSGDLAPSSGLKEDFTKVVHLHK